MKKRIAALLCALLLTAGSVTAGARKPTPTPEPTPVPVASIATAEEFMDFARRCAVDTFSRGFIFSLEADIDLSGRDFAPIPYFAGTFLGNGRMIRGLSLTADGSRAGLFRTVGPEGLVQDLRVKGTVSPGGSGEYVGGVAGICDGTLENCSFEGSVSGISHVGGVAGAVGETGSVLGCSFAGDVAAEHQAGGIAGSSSGLIRDCASAGAVNTVLITPRQEPGFDLAAFSQDDFLDVANIGGIAGENAGVISGCRNTGDVGYKNTGYNVGGIAGKSSGFIAGCENRGSVSARRDAGGIVGQLIPYTVWDFSDGRLDELQKQLGTLSYLINKASKNADEKTSALAGTLSGIRGDTGSAISQLEGLFKRYEENQNRLIDRVQRDPETGEITIRKIDLSGIDASGLASALNSLHARYVSLAGDLDSSMSAITGGLDGITSQLAKVMNTMFTLVSELSQSRLVTTSDLSASETYDHDLGAVEGCENYGDVTADNNAGGVAGSVGFEVEFDMEDRLNAASFITSEAKETMFAALRGCASYGAVTARESRAGGIAGSMDMGAVADSVCAGAVTAESGDYAGGVAGSCAGTLRGCWARCVLSGGKYVGGVAGLGRDISLCRAWAHLDRAAEYAGAVAGWADGTLEGNLYVDDAVPGVDGVAFHTQCDPLSAEDMLSLEGAPESFEAITVTFLGEHGVISRVTVPFGGGVDSLPEVANDADRYWKWDEFEREHIYRSLTVTGRYYAPGTVLSWGEEPPLFLAEGVFYEGQSLSVWPLSADADGREVLCAYTLQVNDYKGDLTVRMRTQEQGELFRMEDGGERTQLSYRTDGQYIVFTLPNGASFLYAAPASAGPDVPWGVILGAVAAASVFLGVFLARKKEKDAAAS